MLYKVGTEHGPARITVDFNDVGATATLDWGGLTHLGTLTYTFDGPINLLASEGTSAEVVARLAASHFDRTEKPTDGANLHFRIADIAVNKALYLIALQ